MEKNTNKKSASALIGAAFLMATSAIGPGFLTQTGQFTGNLKGSFGFVILVSVFSSNRSAMYGESYAYPVCVVRTLLTKSCQS